MTLKRSDRGRTAWRHLTQEPVLVVTLKQHDSRRISIDYQPLALSTDVGPSSNPLSLTWITRFMGPHNRDGKKYIIIMNNFIISGLYYYFLTLITSLNIHNCVKSGHYHYYYYLPAVLC